MRSDVARHRAALIEAATEVFATHGVNVALDAVVEAAGVGRATLYRHFPDRTALLLALFDRQIAPLLAAPPTGSGDALITMIRQMGLASRGAAVLSDAWRTIAPDNAELQQRQKALRSALEKPLADAIEAGRVRADLTIDDVITIIRMVAGAARHVQGGEGAADRAIDLVLNGIRKQA
jgi:AcrR family transcriptional regulator